MREEGKKQEESEKQNACNSTYKKWCKEKDQMKQSREEKQKRKEQEEDRNRRREEKKKAKRQREADQQYLRWSASKDVNRKVNHKVTEISCRLASASIRNKKQSVQEAREGKDVEELHFEPDKVNSLQRKQMSEVAPRRRLELQQNKQAHSDVRH